MFRRLTSQTDQIISSIYKLSENLEGVVRADSHLFDILKEYSSNSELKDDADFCQFLDEHEERITQLTETAFEERGIARHHKLYR